MFNVATTNVPVLYVLGRLLDNRAEMVLLIIYIYIYIYMVVCASGSLFGAGSGLYVSCELAIICSVMPNKADSAKYFALSTLVSNIALLLGQAMNGRARSPLRSTLIMRVRASKFPQLPSCKPSADMRAAKAMTHQASGLSLASASYSAASASLC